MSRLSHRSTRGATLLEVVLAMALMVICVLGLLGTHLALARHAQTTRAFERAAFFADAIAETAISAATGAAEQWKARGAAIVPQAVVALAGSGGDVTVATVTWAAAQNESARNGIAPPATCNGTVVTQGRDCIALAFVR